MMKHLLNLMEKLPKEAFVDDKVYTFTVTQSQWDLMQEVEQDVATWNSSEATNSGTDLNSKRLIQELRSHCGAKRTHLALAKDAPIRQPVQRSDANSSGLHHRYARI